MGERVKWDTGLRGSLAALGDGRSVLCPYDLTLNYRCAGPRLGREGPAGNVHKRGFRLAWAVDGQSLPAAGGSLTGERTDERRAGEAARAYAILLIVYGSSRSQ